MLLSCKSSVVSLLKRLGQVRLSARVNEHDGRGDTFAVNYAANADGGVVANDVLLTVVSVVPGPGTWALMIVAASGLGMAALRRRRLRLDWSSDTCS